MGRKNAGRVYVCEREREREREREHLLAVCDLV